MAYTTPRTWVAGDVLTAAQLNTDVRDNISFLANPPSAIARRAASQSIANATWTLITFDTEDRDTDGMFTVASGDRITIVTAGLYHVEFKAAFSVNVNGDRAFQICKGIVVDTGGFARATGKATAIDSSATIGGDIPLIAGDTLSFQVYQNSAGALNTEATAYGHPRASARWVSK